MERNTLITDAKIDWLAKKGYVIKHVNNGAVTYTVTALGAQYLNDKKD